MCFIFSFCSLNVVQSFSMISSQPRATSSSISKVRHERISLKNPLLLNAQDGRDSDMEEEKKGNFDAQGFAGYLAPYVLAVVFAIGATVAFLKFVLLDY